MPTNLIFRTGNAVTVGSTETSLAVNGGSVTLQALTNKGVYSLMFGSTAMVKGDEYRWRVYEKPSTGATKRLLMSGTISDAQSEVIVIPHLMLGLGWDMTLQRISATSRAFNWSIRQVST